MNEQMIYNDRRNEYHNNIQKDESISEMSSK